MNQKSRQAGSGSDDSDPSSVSPVLERPKCGHGLVRERCFAFRGRCSLYAVKTREVWAEMEFPLFKILLKFLTKFSLPFNSEFYKSFLK